MKNKIAKILSIVLVVVMIAGTLPIRQAVYAAEDPAIETETPNNSSEETDSTTAGTSTPKPTSVTTTVPTTSDVQESSSSDSQDSQDATEATTNGTSKNTDGNDDSTKFTVTFDTNGGSAIESQQVNNGGTAKEPEAPTKDGFTFGGWYEDATFTAVFDFATPITADVKAYAKWTKDETEKPAFAASKTVDGVIITVEAIEGVFPEGAVLSVKRVPIVDQSNVDKAIENERDVNAKVAVSYSFDIKVLDKEGNEVQPADAQSVKVSFALAEAKDNNLEAQVYHISDKGNAEALDTSVKDGAVEAVTDGFSFYTVEFTYGTMTYVLPGDSEVKLSDVLSYVGLSGEVTAASGSNDELFSVTKESGEWMIHSHQPFNTEEKLSVTINGIVYEIIVTDSNVSGTIYASSLTDNDSLVLTGDTTLVMDVNKSLKSISGGYALTVQGGNTLTINSSSNAITVSTLTITSNVQATSSSSDVFCIDVEKDISFSGGSLKASGAGGIRSKSGNITLEGDVTATGSISAGILAQKGTVTIKSGTITATGASSGEARWNYGIGALKSVLVQGGTVTASGNYGIYAEDGYIYLNGTITANGVDRAIYAKNGTLEMHGAITAKSTGTDYPCVDSDGNITFSGTKLEATGGAGIRSLNGDITLEGDVTATGSISAGILAQKGTVTIKSGTITATGATSGEGRWHYGIAAGGNITTEEVTNITAVGGTAMYSEGNIVIGGTLNAQGNDYGIYSNGNVTVEGGPVIARAFSGAGIYAVNTITIESPWMIVTPESGEISGHAIVDSSSNTATYVVIDTPHHYTITFDPNGGTVSPTSATTNAEGRLDSLPTPTREGYMFLNWCSEPVGGYSIGTSKIYTEDTTIYAQWVKKSYTITFDPNGGNVSPTSATTNSEGRLDSLPTPTREGYTFLNWCSEPVGGYSIGTSKIYTADTTIYAHWVKKSYTVTFDSHSGSAVPSQTVEHGDKATRPADPTRGGFTFDDWYADAAYTTKFDFDTPITAPRTIYAKWTPILLSFTVDFNVDGGSTVPSQTVIEGGKVTKPADPTKEGFTFAGWYANSRKTRAFDFENTEIYEDTTIYAKWVENGTQRYYVTFVYGSHTLASQRVYSGGYATRPTSVIPPEHGLVFVDWYADSELTTLFDFENTPITGNTRVYSKWVAGYVVTFEPNNGGHLIEINVEGGKTVEKPDDPTKEGFTFGGWYTNWEGTEAFDFSTPITEDIKLYAKWIEITPTTYSIFFNANGGSGTMAAITVNIGDKLTLPECGFAPQEGKTFDRWDAGNPGEQVEIVSDCTITAIWKENNATYTVTFENNGGSAVASQMVNNGEKATKPADPTKSGFVFDGWYQDATFSAPFDFDTPITADVTIYAKFVPVTITGISIATPGKTAYTVGEVLDVTGMEIKVDYSDGTSKTIPVTAAMVSGFDSSAPADSQTLTITYEGKTTTYDVSISAATPVTYDITVNAGANGTANASATAATEGTTINVTATPDSGYEIDKVTYTPEGGSETDITGSLNFTMPAAKVTVNVTFKASVYTVTVQNDGNGTATANVASGTAGTEVTLTATPNSGYQFKKWQVVSGGVTVTDNKFTIGTENVVVKAIFEEDTSATEYTVTFNANGHGTAPAAQTITSGGTATEPTAPTAEGWNFGGWYQDATCSVAFDFATPITVDIVLYAKWTEVTPGTVYYTVVSGGNSSFTIGNASDIVVTVKRSEADETCFSHFTGVEIDGVALVNGTDYTAVAGSTVVTIKAATLNNLSAGGHTIKVIFDDGEATTSVTAKAASNNNNNNNNNSNSSAVPSTGETLAPTLFVGIAFIAVAGMLFAVILVQRKKKTEQR